MTITAMLEEMQDVELRKVSEQIDSILASRDKERKAKAIEEAKAFQSQALSKARDVLAAAGLTLKDLSGGRKKALNGRVYRSGTVYQHPANKALQWNAKGQKPKWLRELETQGGSATETIGMAAMENTKKGI